MDTIGVKFHMQREDSKEKRKQTLIDKYGTLDLSSVPEIKEKIVKTLQSHFGEEYQCAFQLPSVRQKMYEVTSKNKGTSKAEDRVAGYLEELGYAFERFKTSKEYHNYHAVADFYLTDYDVYIEFQGSQFHHGRAFFGTEEDMIELERLKKKDKENADKGYVENQYAEMVTIWTIKDVFKRQEARDNGIKLLEVFECKSKEDLNKQLSFFIKCLSSDDEFEKLYGENPVLRRKLIQEASKRCHKRESELTREDLENELFELCKSEVISQKV